MSTARDFIILALKESGVLGVGQSPLAEDINDAFVLLNRMIATWQKKRWIVPSLYDIATLGNGLKSNPIGPGQYWNAPRPDKIQAAYFVQNVQPLSPPNPVSFPLRPIWSYEDYALVTLKEMQSWPMFFFYDAAYPFGNVHIWPIPDSTYIVHLILKSPIGFESSIETGHISDDGSGGAFEFTVDSVVDSLDSEFNMPPEYEEAIHYNLCIRLCSMYQYPVNPVQAGLAKLALNTVKIANAQIPTLKMPGSLRNRGGGNSFYIFNADAQ